MDKLKSEVKKFFMERAEDGEWHNLRIVKTIYRNEFTAEHVARIKQKIYEKQYEKNFYEKNVELLQHALTYRKIESLDDLEWIIKNIYEFFSEEMRTLELDVEDIDEMINMFE